MDQNTNSIEFQNHNAMFYSEWIEFDDYVAYLNGFNYVDDVSLYHSPVWLKLIENITAEILPNQQFNIQGGTW